MTHSASDLNNPVMVTLASTSKAFRSKAESGEPLITLGVMAMLFVCFCVISYYYTRYSRSKA